MNVTLDTANLIFSEKIAAFLQKLNLVGTERYDDLRAEEHYRAFAVAGAMQADLLADLAAAVAKAVLDGTSLQEFRRDFFEAVEKHGWTGWTGEGTKGGEAWRTRVIYRTNARKAYSAGRYAQLTDPTVAAALPYWKWVHSGLARDPRAEHLAWHGMTLHHTDPFWQTYFPPRIPPDYGCGCRVVAVEKPEDGARTTAPDGWEDSVDPGAGAPPQDVLADMREFIAGKKDKLPPELAQGLGEVVERYRVDLLAGLAARAAQASKSASHGASQIDAAAAFVTAALSERKVKQKPVSLGDMPDSFVTRSTALGLVTQGKSFALDHDYTLHIFDKHGGASEATRGQLPVTPEDFERLRVGLNQATELAMGDPPRSGNGSPRIHVVVEIDGFRLEAIMEVRRKVLVPYTLWKRRI